MGARAIPGGRVEVEAEEEETLAPSKRRCGVARHTTRKVELNARDDSVYRISHQ